TAKLGRSGGIYAAFQKPCEIRCPIQHQASRPCSRTVRKSRWPNLEAASAAQPDSVRAGDPCGLRRRRGVGGAQEPISLEPGDRATLLRGMAGQLLVGDRDGAEFDAPPRQLTVVWRGGGMTAIVAANSAFGER